MPARPGTLERFRELSRTSADTGITLATTVSATRNQVSCELDGEAVILQIEDGVYYVLNPVGARIWNLLEQPRTIRQIRDTILEEYAVESDRCEVDLLALLNELAARRLIDMQ